MRNVELERGEETRAALSPISHLPSPLCSHHSSCRVVITGIGLVTPLGLGRERTWQALKRGEHGIARLEEACFSELAIRIAGMVQPEAVGRGSSSGSLPGEARDDRFIRFALAAADEALDDSGLLRSGVDPERVGCVLGSSKGGVLSLLSAHAAYRRGEGLREDFLLQVLPDMASVRVAAQHGLRGFVGNQTAACATGPACIIQGADRIRHGLCDAVVAGASDASITPLIFAGFDRMGVLSREPDDPGAACKPYDVRRDGFVVGEGAAAVILESRVNAEARRARIYGELAGWALGAQGHHEVNPEPSGAALAHVIRVAMQKAGLDPSDIGYVNAHGTGTISGDITETRAIKRAFGQAVTSLAVSSTKPQTGHLLGAAGGLEFALSVLALRDGFIPATINLTQAAPECDLDYVPHEGRRAKLRAAMSLSAGFGGQIAALVATH